MSILEEGLYEGIENRNMEPLAGEICKQFLTVGKTVRLLLRHIKPQW